MRLERTLAALAVLVVGAALFTGFPAAGDIFGSPIAAEFRLPGDEDLPNGGAAETPRRTLPHSTQTGDPARAFLAPEIRADVPAADGVPGGSANPTSGVPGGGSRPLGGIRTGGADLALTLPEEPTGAPVTTPEEAALSWLERQHAPFGLRYPRKELRLSSAVDGTGGAVVTFRQVLGKLPVLNSSVTVRLDKDGQVLSADGHTSHAPASAAYGAVLSSDQAAEVALERASLVLGAGTDVLQAAGTDIWLADPALGASFSGEARPAWQVTVGGPGESVTVLVDARTGEALSPAAPTVLEPPVETETPTPPPSVDPEPPVGEIVTPESRQVQSLPTS